MVVTEKLQNIFLLPMRFSNFLCCQVAIPDCCPPDGEVAQTYEEERDNEGHTEEELPGMDVSLVCGREVVTLAQAGVVPELSVPLAECGQDQTQGVEPDSQHRGQVPLPPVQIPGHLRPAQTQAPAGETH